MKRFKKYSYEALAFGTACMCLFLNASAQDATGIDLKKPGNWIEENWVLWIVLGVILLIILIPSGSRKTTTTTIKRDGGNTTEITTVKEE